MRRYTRQPITLEHAFSINLSRTRVFRPFGGLIEVGKITDILDLAYDLPTDIAIANEEYYWESEQVVTFFENILNGLLFPRWIFLRTSDCPVGLSDRLLGQVGSCQVYLLDGLQQLVTLRRELIGFDDNFIYPTDGIRVCYDFRKGKVVYDYFNAESFIIPLSAIIDNQFLTSWFKNLDGNREAAFIKVQDTARDIYQVLRKTSLRLWEYVTIYCDDPQVTDQICSRIDPSFESRQKALSDRVPILSESDFHEHEML